MNASQNFNWKVHLFFCFRKCCYIDSIVTLISKRKIFEKYLLFISYKLAAHNFLAALRLMKDLLSTAQTPTKTFISCQMKTFFLKKKVWNAKALNICICSHTQVFPLKGENGRLFCPEKLMCVPAFHDIIHDIQLFTMSLFGIVPHQFQMLFNCMILFSVFF